MGHVFSLQAIATCEQQGHEFAWVQTWHDVGFDECRRCGLTTTMPTASAIVPGSTVDAPETSTSAPSIEGAKPDMPRVSGAQAELPVVAWASRPARDFEVRRRMAAGESVESIASHFGISQQRVYQIAPARRTRGN